MLQSFTLISYLRPPGFEPGSLAWKAKILPLDYGRCKKKRLGEFKNYRYFTMNSLILGTLMSPSVKTLNARKRMYMSTQNARNKVTR